MSDRQFDVLLKILLIGDMGVGKSCILLRYSDDVFNAAHVSTIGVDFKIRTAVKDDKVAKLQIWDTAGQERFRTITTTYYKGAHGIILVYDVTKKDTFDNIKTWLADVREYAEDDVTILLVGNKIDLEKQRQVSTEMGQEYAQELGVPFVETSAKNSTNIEDAFLSLVDEIFKKKFDSLVVDKPKPQQPVNITKSQNLNKKKKCC
eukprot:gb/GECH01012960.1/.p1 GENE.gb/GECH01012960.1/~~gb/GECH01012960.1/.p1  ORF type:complete len:205 (+),score=40.82 gb/GECH01012960.1/:1-615(+)